MFLHTEALHTGNFQTQKLLHTEKSLHSEAFTCRSLYAVQNRNLTLFFDVRPPFCAKGLLLLVSNFAILHQFLTGVLTQRSYLLGDLRVSETPTKLVLLKFF